MGVSYARIALMFLVVAAVIALAIWLICFVLKALKRRGTKTSAEQQVFDEETISGPMIIAYYQRSGSFMEDGKCGWLDIENENGGSQTVKLNFDKKHPAPMHITLQAGTYRITYRTQSKAAMLASGVLTSINESNGALGAFANAVYDAGGMNGAFETIVVKVDDSFLLKLRCSTDGLTKKCEIVS